MGHVWSVGHQSVTFALVFGADLPGIHIPFKLD